MNDPMFSLKGPKMKSGEKGYDTNFALEHALKDARFAQALGDHHGISMSVNTSATGKFTSESFLSLIIILIAYTDWGLCFIFRQNGIRLLRG